MMPGKEAWMSQGEPGELDPLRIRSLQIIAAVLPAGVLIFLAVVFFLVEQRGPNAPQDPPVVSIMAIGCFVVAVALRFVVPGVMVGAFRRQLAKGTWPPASATMPPGLTDQDKLLGLYQTQMVVGAALLEGTGFFGCIAYLLQGWATSAAIAGASVLIMLATFPTTQRVRNWLESQLPLLEADRRGLAEP
jgi:hypothetical protein